MKEREREEEKGKEAQQQQVREIAALGFKKSFG